MIGFNGVDINSIIESYNRQITFYNYVINQLMKIEDELFFLCKSRLSPDDLSKLYESLEHDDQVQLFQEVM